MSANRASADKPGSSMVSTDIDGAAERDRAHLLQIDGEIAAIDTRRRELTVERRRVKDRIRMREERRLIRKARR